MKESLDSSAYAWLHSRVGDDGARQRVTLQAGSQNPVVFMQQLGQHLSAVNFEVAPSLQLGLCTNGARFGKQVSLLNTIVSGSQHIAINIVVA